MVNSSTAGDVLKSSIDYNSELPLFRMVYSSHVRYAALYNPKVFVTLARQVIRNNKKNNITGVLCFGNGYFLQYVEGSEEALTNLKNKLLQDGRHYGFNLTDFSQIEGRTFCDPPMGFAIIEQRFHFADCSLKKYMPLDPMSWTLNKQLELIQGVKNHGLLDKNFKLNKFDTLVFQIQLLIQLTQENITKKQIFLVFAILGFSTIVLLLCLLAFGVLS